MKKFCYIIIIFALFLASNLFPQVVSELIIIDQFGWLEDSRKVVIFANPINGQNSGAGPYFPGGMFRIRRASDNVTVYSNTISAWNSGNEHAQSGDKVWWGDFSAFKTPGEYYVYDQANNKKSYNFAIGSTIYQDVLKAAVKTYYYQRCGTDVSVACGGNWNHAICHSQDANAELYTTKADPMDVRGGWHDAGDYNKYIPFLDQTVWELMVAYELNPSRFSDDYNIPETGNGVPDIVDEIKWELDWMIRMQMPNGSVANRTAADSPSVRPHLDGATRYYTAPTTWSTATFAAILAHASRLFENFQAEYGNYYQTLLEKATNAWSYLETEPNMYPANGEDGACGLGAACGTSTSDDDKRRRVFASAELFSTTGGAKYHEYFTNNYKNYAETRDNGQHPIEDNVFDASSAVSLNQAFFVYARAAGAKSQIITEIKNSLRTGLDWYQITYYNNQSDAYRAYMFDGHYCWGSSQIKARWGNILVLGIALNVDPTKNMLYKEIAEEYLHYFHGRNPLSWVYMTGVTNLGADKCVTEIYHSWFHDGDAWYDGAPPASLYGPAPGFVPGGPNQFFGRNISPPQGEPPQKAYKDWNTSWPEDSWEITEPAIYYQSAYIMLLSACASASRITISNFAATPSLITNNLPRLVTFQADIYSSGGNITTATLNLAPIGGTKVRMTNVAGTLWQYSYIVPADTTVYEYDLDITAYDDVGSIGFGLTSLMVISSAYLPLLILYDGGDNSPETDFLYGWDWGAVSFKDVTTDPKFGTYCGQIYWTNMFSGIAHVRDNSWTGIDCLGAEKLEFWIKASDKLATNEGVIVKLYSVTTNLGKSAAIELSLTTNWRKVDIDVSFLTNGAEPSFTMENIVGVEFGMADYTPGGTIVYVDDIILAATIIVSNEKANPGIVDKTADTSVAFTCMVESIENISTVTLDLSPLGGGYGKIELVDIGGGIYSNAQLITADSVPEGNYTLPIIAHDISGKTGIGRVNISVAGVQIAILGIVYNGETPLTDANWDCWWPAAASGVGNRGSSFEDSLDDVRNGTYSGKFYVWTNVHSGGAHIPDNSMWMAPWDVSGANNFEFYFKAANGVTIELQLFSYDPIDGTRSSTPLSLTGNGNWLPVRTNMNYFTNGQFNLRKFVGVELSADAGVVVYFDDMLFSANVLVKNELVIPSLVTNIHDNTVQFFADAITANLSIDNVYIDLNLLGGPANAVMTKIVGDTYRYTFTVRSNQSMSSYSIPITARSTTV